MTPDERALLQTFLRDLQNTQGVAKDPEADAMINQALGASPAAAYVLVQHAILSDQALHAAQQQIAALQAHIQQQQAQPAPQPTSFLQPQPVQPGPWSTPTQAAPVQAAAQPAGFMGPGPFHSGGGLGSFMRTAGTTAAGVAGGALLFEGVSSLFGGHGFGGGSQGNVTNNYYDDDNDDGGSDDDGSYDDDDSSSDNN